MESEILKFQLLRQLINRQNLTIAESQSLAEAMLAGEISDIEMAALLTALQTKGFVSDELIGFVNVFRQKSLRIHLKAEGLLDTCGTGGDDTATFNISTTVAFVVSACGVNVAKHGNKAASSKCGSADVLKALGVNIDLAPQQVEQCIEKNGIAFLFAPNFHPEFKKIAPIRNALKIRTIFNLLGPLLNPVSPDFQVIGIYDPNILEIYAETLQNLGLKHAMVVHGSGLDEITNTGETIIYELENGNIFNYKIKPEDFGFKRVKIDDLRGGDVLENAEIAKNILSGKEKGPKRDIVLLNSAACLKVSNKVLSWEKGIQMANDAIDTGKAFEKLEKLINFKISVS
ncbi:MAG: anthranilate phosphoribosyltransferase, anthranilate phosphoribosyltransferase [Candidatus Peregrinibacteria bacterium GW2011_GWF2_33_10]|nr:MAG: anthranilate phosphoribosyltransferase, anthranilate phosphoribosyltransferase [Candidatus Peregrinibacteria bacterium GW2011_GWF2_33_10]OGJ45422.1 MAG: anthranilate phosphoribosyltransferase [Candidatus Peregrinibacteria bacterium RIFOXYA2_FULL_33_21]OGJ45543.1 MAG: anthranilate phosphoribosyltransferase [Candidatus Peregrinibacteria bacterium RIFOXYA12_FULL_33_12]OGJ51025.1 MAG: anthranilate phosphoribosyltransferase [Candidatus Peregrinibacteria bacterium RIFOXYB2_FULL_33_20]